MEAERKKASGGAQTAQVNLQDAKNKAAAARTRLDEAKRIEVQAKANREDKRKIASVIDSQDKYKYLKKHIADADKGFQYAFGAGGVVDFSMAFRRKITVRIRHSVNALCANHGQVWTKYYGYECGKGGISYSRMETEGTNCNWNMHGSYAKGQWVKDWLGECGIAPLNVVGLSGEKLPTKMPPLIKIQLPGQPLQAPDPNKTPNLCVNC